MKEDGLDAAIKLTEDLLNTVRQEAERAQSYGYGRGRPSYNGVSIKTHLILVVLLKKKNAMKKKQTRLIQTFFFQLISFFF